MRMFILIQKGLSDKEALHSEKIQLSRQTVWRFRKTIKCNAKIRMPIKTQTDVAFNQIMYAEE